MADIDENRTFLARSQNFLMNRVIPWWRDIICQWPVDVRRYSSELLLAGVYLGVRDLVEALQQGGTYFRITPFRVEANDEAVLVLDIETQGRVREVSIWMDSAVGLPDPTIRLSTGASGTAGNGVRVLPGGPNELGKVPPNTKLFLASDVTINGYVIERG